MTPDNPVRFEYLGNTPSPDVPIRSIILLSVVLHSLLYWILPSSFTPLMKSYVISTIHAVICVLSVVNFFARYSVNLKQANRLLGGGVYGTGDEIMAYSICYSIGYFIYDLILMLFHQSIRTSSALAHHIIIIISFSSGVMNGICHPCHFYLLGEELSTIPLNFKSIYRQRPRLYKFFGYLFIFAFFLCRLIYGSIICAYAFRAAPRVIRMGLAAGDLQSVIIGLVQSALCLFTRGLNIYWSVLILRKLISSPKSKKKDA